jgi:hypothetical protein
MMSASIDDSRRPLIPSRMGELGASGGIGAAGCWTLVME